MREAFIHILILELNSYTSETLFYQSIKSIVYNHN